MSDVLTTAGIVGAIVVSTTAFFCALAYIRERILNDYDDIDWEP
jgi:hypothetical protein